MSKSPLRIGIGGPVGSGKTALVDALCKTMRERYQLGVITTDLNVLASTSCSACRPFTSLKSAFPPPRTRGLMVSRISSTRPAFSRRPATGLLSTATSYSAVSTVPVRATCWTTSLTTTGSR